MSRAQRATFLFVEPTGRPSSSRPLSEQAGVELTMSPTDFSVVPGEQVSTELRVANAGTVVDQYSLSVEGDAAAWATVDPSSVNLYPDSDPAVVGVTFSPPREPGTHPGAIRVTVRATSRSDPTVTSAAQGFLRVAPYVDITSDLLPSRSEGRRRASHELVVNNRGNDTVSVPVTAADPSELLEFAVTPPLLAPGPGQRQSTQLSLKARKWLWTGAPQVRPFRASVNPAGADPQSLDGQFRQTAVLPKWAVRLLVILVPLLVLLIAYFAATASVPDVKGQSEIAATTLLTAHGFNPTIVPQASDTVPTGTVISTAPTAGSRKRRGSGVDVFLSEGMNPVTVPNVVGLDQTQATAQLLGLGFVVIDMDQANPATSGLVIGTTPVPNTQLQPRSTVTLLISTGPGGASGAAGGAVPGGGSAGSGSGSGGSGSGSGGSGSGESSTTPPTLVASSAVALPAQLVTTTSPVQSLSIGNQGTTTLTVTSLTMGGANAGDFAVANDGCTGIPLASGASCPIGITFTPSGAGARTASLSIISNAGGSPHLIALSGTGLAPTVGVNPMNLDFSPQQAGLASATQNVVLTNSGNGRLTVGSIALGGPNASDFHKVSDSCSGATVAPLGSCTMAIAFDPAPGSTSPSSRTGTLTITSSAGGGTQDVVTLAGTAVSPSLQLSSAVLQLTTLAGTGIGGQGMLTVSNAGTLAVTMGAPYLTGGNSSAFTLTSTCKGALAPGASCTVTVTNSVSPPCTATAIDLPDDAPVPGSNQQVPVIVENTSGSC